MDQIFDQSDLLLERLMAAIGKGNASAAERQQLEVTLPLMRKLYEHRVRHITTTERVVKRSTPSASCYRNCR